MRANAALPELITPDARSIAADGGLDSGGAFFTGVVDREAAWGIEAITTAAILYIPANGPAMDGMTAGAILQTAAQLGPAIEAITVAAILQTT